MIPAPPAVELLERVAAEDHQATRELVAALTDPLIKFFRGFGRLTDEDREELTQDTLLAALNSLDRYDRSKPFITWIYGIAKKKALSRLKKDRHEWTEGRLGLVQTTVPLLEETDQQTDGGALTYESDVDLEGPERAGMYHAAIATESTDVSIYDTTLPHSEYLTDLLTDVRVWIASLSGADQIVATHFTHGISYPEVAIKLTEKLGMIVSHSAARVRGTRFAEKVRRQFPNVLSTVRPSTHSRSSEAAR